MNMAKAHAELGASSSARWMQCPGSVPLSRAFERTTSSYAAEGTVAHTLCEAMLTGGEIPSSGSVVEQDGYSVLITQEMHDAVQTYADALKPYIDRAEWHGYEQRVHIHSAPEGAELFGTADAVAIVPLDKKARELVVGDLKYGKGVVVDIEFNSQVLFYALATYETLMQEEESYLLDNLRQIRMIVVQPRIDGAAIKEWVIDLIDLMIWRDTQLIPAVLRVMEGDDSLQDGTHCRFCPAISGCPLKRELALQAAATEFSIAEEVYVNSNSGEVHDVSELLTLADRLEDWIKAIRLDAMRMLREGHDIDGFKVVHGRSHRKWAGEDSEIMNELVRRSGATDRLVEDLVKPPELRSPAQVEKALKRHKRDPDQIMRDLVVKPAGKPTLVVEADPRPAIAITQGLEFDEWVAPSNDE